MRLNDAELEHIFDHGETFHVERKESMQGSAPNSIREAVCAFANDLSGSNRSGLIFVGIKDNGRPSYIAVTDALLRQLADIKTDGNIVPPPSMFVEQRTVKGIDVAVVTVLPSDSPPVRYKGAIYVRISPRKGIATAQDERILNERRRYGNAPFDVQPVPSADISVLNSRQFEEEYLPRAFSSEVLDANDRTLEQRLAATKMIASIDDTTATILGILVIGKRPRDYIENNYIQFLRIEGTSLGDDIIDDEVIDGSVSDILRRVDEKFRSHIRTKVNFSNSDREVRASSYPLAALQQIARNAIMHRTYEATNAPVRISWFNDRIEFHNPGGPYGIVNQANFGRPGVTDYRNPNLAEAMKVLGYVQRFGVGIASARRSLRDSGNPDLEFIVEENYVQATIRERL